jgi:hypothetical protein
MKFAEELRKSVDFYENVVDRGIVDKIKAECEKVAKEGKRSIYTGLNMGTATRKHLIEEEGLEVSPALTSTYTYMIRW